MAQGKVFETKIKITGDASDGIQAVLSFSNATDRMGRSLDRAGHQSRGYKQLSTMVAAESAAMSGALAGALAGTQSLTKGFSSLFHVALGVAGFHAVAQGIREVWGAMAEAQGLETGFAAVFGSFAEGQAHMSGVLTLSKDLGLEFRTMARDYQSLAAAARGTNLEGAETTRIFTAISTAGRALNLSADDIHGTLRALQQMISKGNVQAEELRGQLGERLPGALQIAADAMGVTTQELNKMMERGELFADELLPKMADALLEKFGSAAQEASQTALAELGRLNTAIFELSQGLVEAGALDTVAGAVRGITREVSDLADLLAGGGITDSINAIGYAWSESWAAIDVTGEAVDTVLTDISALFDGFLDRAFSGLLELPANFVGVWAIARGELEKTFTKLIAGADQLVMAVKAGAEQNKLYMVGAWETVVGTFKSLWAEALSWFAAKMDAVMTPLLIGADFLGLDSLRDGIARAVKDLDGFVANAQADAAKYEGAWGRAMAAAGASAEQLRDDIARSNAVVDKLTAQTDDATYAVTSRVEELTTTMHEAISSSMEMSRQIQQISEDFLALDYAASVGGKSVLAAFDMNGKRVELPEDLSNFDPDLFTWKIVVELPEPTGADYKHAKEKTQEAIDAQIAELDRLREALLDIQALDDPFGAGAQKALLKYEQTMKKLDKDLAGYNEGKEMALELLRHELEMLDPLRKAWADYSREIAVNASFMADKVIGAYRSMQQTFADMLKTGKLDFADFTDFIINAVADMISNIMTQNLMNALAPLFGMPVGPSSSITGSLTSLGVSAIGGASYMGSSLENMLFDTLPFDMIGNIFHSGGVPKAGESQGERYVHAAVFADAPRYHSGVGPRNVADFEEAAIIRKDEGVFTPGQMSALAPMSYVRQAVAEAVKQAVGTSGGGDVVFSPVYQIDASGTTPDMLQRVNDIAQRQADRAMGEFKREIQKGGPAARLVGRRNH